MDFVNRALSKILFRKNDFCCLCFNKVVSEDTFQFGDEVIIDNERIMMSDIIRSFLPLEVPQQVALNGMCSNCTKMIMSSYKFIKMVKDNWTELNILLQLMDSSLHYNMQQLDNYKTLFLNLGTSDCSSKHYFDNSRFLFNKTLALKRFQEIISNKSSSCCDIQDIVINEDHIIQQETDTCNHSKIKLRKKRTRILGSIPISEMLCDDDSAQKYTCKVCFHIYPTQYNLKQHFVRVHAPKTFKCPSCPRQYGSAWILEQHRYESHNSSVCSQCGKTYSNRHSLKKHEIGHTLNFSCETCGRCFKRKTTYNKHILLKECNRTRMSPSEAQFTCDVCGKKFCQKATLRVHITFEHGNRKAYKCTWCNKRFYAQSKLNAHVVKHTKEKKFSCLQCGGKFVSKESLLYHTRIHTGDKPYKCDLCDDRFLSASRRMAHYKRHHVDAKYECNICQSKFKVKSLLLKHKQKHFEFVN